MSLERLYLTFLGLFITSSLVLGNPFPSIVALAMALYYSLTLHRFKNTEFKVIRMAPKDAVEGKPVTVKLRVHRRGNAKGLLKLREWGEDHTFYIDQERKEVLLRLIPQERGKLSFAESGRIEDSTGLFEEEVRIEGSKEIMIYPSPESLALAFRLARRSPFERAAGLGWGMELLEFYELREFVPGDSIKKIEWKATSKLQKLIVKVLMREIPSKAYLLLNVDDVFLSEYPFSGRVSHLVLILTQLAGYLSRTLGEVTIIAYNEEKVIGHFPLGSLLNLLEKLELRKRKRLYPLRPRAFSKHIIGKGLISATKLVPPGSYTVIVDDIGLYPSDITRAVFMLRRKGCRETIIYPNPELFLQRDRSEERDDIMKKLSAKINLIEVGPLDTVEKVVKRL